MAFRLIKNRSWNLKPPVFFQLSLSFLHQLPRDCWTTQGTRKPPSKLAAQQAGYNISRPG